MKTTKISEQIKSLVIDLLKNVNGLKIEDYILNNCHILLDNTNDIVGYQGGIGIPPSNKRIHSNLLKATKIKIAAAFATAIPIIILSYPHEPQKLYMVFHHLLLHCL